MKKLLFLVSFLLCCIVAQALIHELDVRNDNRKKFFIENFGFEAGGVVHLTIEKFSFEPPLSKPAASARVGFLIKKTETDSTRFIEENEDYKCLLTDEVISPEDHILRILHWEREDFAPVVIPAGAEGFYNTYFINCEEEAVNFNLRLEQYNVGHNYLLSAVTKNYLSAGTSPLPSVYGCLFILYISVLGVWVLGFLRAPGNRVFSIHYLMTVLIVIKTLSVLFKSIEMHYLKLRGHPGGWDVIYYFFAFLRGVMMFVVIALIGTGWTFVKPFLSDKDKRIFLIVIPLQILDNIAMVIIEETTPGTQGWFTWKDIFRLVDIICCGAILVPIIWSIKHLKEASQIDGKAARNIQKLKLFRQFYLLVVSYIYFTRIIVYLLDATLPFRWVWLGDFFTEMATFAFYLTTGYKFRPVPDNPFFTLDDDDEKPSSHSEKSRQEA
eukprot:TRINITY_DN5911_c0_g3_i1.p1 TRINITY_DN5911_c0_g3~~TRINITY_DN5911_c0_g3_i1.p1  ORF type:complete len:439 (+),score=98.89 TRINITY_DN5911_c0_g3_i1:287-1603(+)